MNVRETAHLPTGASEGHLHGRRAAAHLPAHTREVVALVKR